MNLYPQVLTQKVFNSVPSVFSVVRKNINKALFLTFVVRNNKNKGSHPQTA